MATNVHEISAGRSTPETKGAIRDAPRNAWWVAAFADEVGREPMARWLLGRPVVLYRREDGRVAALDDRCPHRWAPLSQGKLVGDEIQCPYHGYQFDGDGRCTRIPTQETVPSRVRVASYPVHESGPFVWIWMGDEGCQDDEEAPQPIELEWYGKPDWAVVKGALPMKANYMLIQENVLDLTHFTFLHANSLQQTGWTEPAEQYTGEGRRIGYDHLFRNIHLSPAQGGMTGLGSDKPVDRQDWGDFWAPSIHVGGTDVLNPDPEPDARKRYNTRIVHAVTPDGRGGSHYWWMVAQDFGADNPEQIAATGAFIHSVFSEDKTVIEAIQEIVDTDVRGSGVVEISTRADEVTVKARRLVDAMCARENAG